jgi:hypothetical protein
LRLALPQAALTALCLLCAPAQAQWKWRDKDGQINASDRPPPRDIAEQDILARPVPEARRPAAVAAAASAPASSARPVERELESRKRGAEAEQAAKAKGDDERQAAQRAENCRRARSHVAALESGQRMARVNDKGEREVLDDLGRADEMRQAREVISSECR